MGHFSMEISCAAGSLLSGNQQTANADLVGYIAPGTSLIALSERNGNDTAISATGKFNSNFRLRFEATYEI